MNEKKLPRDLAFFGGPSVFQKIRSTSNLVRPEVEKFLSYTKRSYGRRWLTNNGPAVFELEARLAELHQVKHCVAFCNGFWGLVLCVAHLAIPGRTEVIMPTMTYRRLADIAAWAKLTPHFCDIDKDTLGASVSTVEACITQNTGLILIAQPIVNICDMDGLTGLAEEHNVPILFDSVESSFASYKGKMIGSFGDAECFSMHASKLINGFEGGYMTTNRTEFAETIKTVRAFGFSGPDNVVAHGLNAKLNEIHASMALACLDDLQDQVERNRKRYKAYCNALDAVPGLEIVLYDENEKRGYKNILVKLNHTWPITRQKTLDILHAENILARPYYFPPLHKKKTDYQTIKGALPVAEVLSEQYLLLPCGEFVSIEDVETIVELLRFIQDSGPALKKMLENK